MGCCSRFQSYIVRRKTIIVLSILLIATLSFDILHIMSSRASLRLSPRLCSVPDLGQMRYKKSCFFIHMDIREKVGELRRKIRLKALDGRGFYKCTESQKIQNKSLISKMREENKQMRIMLAKSINEDEETIKSAFVKRKRERLEMQRCTAAKAISRMDQKELEGRKRLNVLKHESVQKREQIEKLQTIFKQLKLDDTRDNELEIEQDIRCLQNELDKAGVKCIIAKDITRRYNQIKKYLEQECIMYPSRLDVLEEQRRDARTDLEMLPKINEDAVYHNDAAQRLFMDMKRQMFELRRSQEEVRTQSRKEVERLQQEESDRTEKRMKLTHETDNSDTKAQIQQQEKEDHQEKILKLDWAFEKIKSAIRVSTYSTIDDVVYHVINQDNTRQRLVEQKEQGIRDKERLLEEKETLQAILDELKFKSQFKIAKDRKLVDSVEEFLKEEEDRRNLSLEHMTINEACLLDITSGIATLFDKLKDIKLKLPFYNYPRDDPIEDLTTCERRLEVLSSYIKAEQKYSEIEPVQVDQEKFHSYLEGNIQPTNFRIRLDVDGDSDTEEAFCEDNIGYLSWEVAKRQSIDLINYQLKQKMKKDGRV